jgi:chromosome partitioning protein
MKVYSVVNQKGGVGKTTTAVNLGVAMAKKGRRVLLIDLDPQGNLSTYLGVSDPQSTIADAIMDICNDKEPDIKKYIMRNQEGVDLIPSNLDLSGIELPLSQALGGQVALRDLISQLDNYDDIIIDCPPTLGILSINALAASTDVIVPVQTQFFAMKGLTDLIDTVERVKKKLNKELTIRGILFTYYEKHTRSSKLVVSQVTDIYRNIYPVFNVQIPKAIRAAESPLYGVSMFEYDPESPVTEAYASLCSELLK